MNDQNVARNKKQEQIGKIRKQGWFDTRANINGNKCLFNSANIIFVEEVSDFECVITSADGSLISVQLEFSSFEEFIANLQ